MILKDEIRSILEAGGDGTLTSLSASRKRILTALISMTYEKQSVLAWKAIEAVGTLTADYARSDPQLVRETAERLLWMIRDESGGIGWSAPEMLGEIVRNSPDLFADIATVIVSFHDEPPLRAGVLRAIGRIGRRNESMVAYAIPVVLSYLKSPDVNVRGHAAWALGEIGAIGSVRLLENLRGDTAPLLFYEDGRLAEITVGELAAASLEKLKGLKP